MKITTLLISLSLLPILSHAASNPYNYVTSVKVNQVELNASVTPNQVSQLLAPPNGKTSKQYAKCTGNYEYSITTAQPKTLKWAKSLSFSFFFFPFCTIRPLMDPLIFFSCGIIG